MRYIMTNSNRFLIDDILKHTGYSKDYFKTILRSLDISNRILLDYEDLKKLETFNVVNQKSYKLRLYIIENLKNINFSDFTI